MKSYCNKPILFLSDMKRTVFIFCLISACIAIPKPGKFIITCTFAKSFTEKDRFEILKVLSLKWFLISAYFCSSTAEDNPFATAEDNPFGPIVETFGVADKDNIENFESPVEINVVKVDDFCPKEGEAKTSIDDKSKDCRDYQKDGYLWVIGFKYFIFSLLMIFHFQLCTTSSLRRWWNCYWWWICFFP